jgi:probable rRNA maturation factor
LSKITLGRFVARAQRAARLAGSINVVVTSSADMRALNKRFRGKDQPTDVLSFPAAPNAARDHTAGEIAISAEIAAANARSLGHTAAEEIKILALHGILHLRGYDHEHDSGEMARRESRLRALLRLPVGLIERTAVSRDEKKSGAAGSRPAASRPAPSSQRPPAAPAGRKPSR